jgi:hypothetical protein
MSHIDRDVGRPGNPSMHQGHQEKNSSHVKYRSR